MCCRLKRAGTVRPPRLTHAPVILTRFLPRHGLSHGHSARAGTPPTARPRIRERTSKTESTRKRRGRKTKEKSERRSRRACHLPPIRTAANELRSGRPIPNNASQWWVDARQAARDYRRDRFLAQGGAKKTSKAPCQKSRVGRKKSWQRRAKLPRSAASEKWAPGTEGACLAQQLICHCAHDRAWLVRSSLKDGSRRLCEGFDRRYARREASSGQKAAKRSRPQRRGCGVRRNRMHTPPTSGRRVLGPLA